VSQVNVDEEFRKAPVEPLLPVEKKLIGWSLGIGVVLLVILAIVNQLFPASI
jgi:putative exporter of polyketide antibiotics